MSNFPTFFNWIKKNYSKKNEVKLKFKMSVSFPETVNFLVQFPTTDKNRLIKEYTQKEWTKELELPNSNSVFLKVFLTSTNLQKDMQVKLEIVQLENDDPDAIKYKYFQTGNNFSLNDWMILKWDSVEPS